MSLLMLLAIIAFISFDFLLILIIALRAVHFLMSGVDPAKAVPTGMALLKRADRKKIMEEKVSRLG